MICAYIIGFPNLVLCTLDLWQVNSFHRDTLPRLVARETDRIDGENAVSPIFDVSVRLSPECVNGVPNFDTLASNGQLSSLFSIVECACEPGWTGRI